MAGTTSDGAVVPTVRFAGLTWAVKVAAEPVGPGPNRFAAGSVRAEGGAVRLQVLPDGRGWVCAEIVALGTFGYGTYTWDVEVDVPGLDPSSVLGMFTWSHRPEHHHREIDVELGRWGDPGAELDGLHVVQPGGPGHEHRFETGRSGRGRHTIDWAPGRVRLTSTGGGQTHSWSVTGAAVPPAGGGVAPRINLWMFRGRAPTRPQSVRVTGFGYRP
ncbi:hypothetical protein [Ornithinimicrobium sp. W1665]|uniref:hypothetical protein n=1 Tax=Ornithinimicrobium sp. W1665 TaxID=3416666 RepID=UPI003CF94927